MTITIKDSRQEVVCAFADFALADLAASGSFNNAIQVPADAIVLGGYIAFSEVFNSTTSDVFTVGDTVDDDEYGAAISGQAAALTALVPTGYKYAAQTYLGIKWTSGGGTPTTGIGRLVVYYMVTTKCDFTQG